MISLPQITDFCSTKALYVFESLYVGIFNTLQSTKEKTCDTVYTSILYEHICVNWTSWCRSIICLLHIFELRHSYNIQTVYFYRLKGSLCYVLQFNLWIKSYGIGYFRGKVLTRSQKVSGCLHDSCLLTSLSPRGWRECNVQPFQFLSTHDCRNILSKHYYLTVAVTAAHSVTICNVVVPCDPNRRRAQCTSIIKS